MITIMGDQAELKDPDFIRCNWYGQFGGTMYLCLLLPDHGGDVHKFLDAKGEIRTYRVESLRSINREYLRSLRASMRR